MQAIIRQLRFVYNQRQLLDLIDQEVDELAKSDRAYVTFTSDTDPTRRILPADRRQEYLGKLLQRKGFLQRLRNEVQRTLRGGNIQKQTYPTDGPSLNERLPEDGPFIVRGTRRFHDVEAIFETPNVGLIAAIGNWIVDHSRFDLVEDIGLDDDEQTITVLAWHCGIVGLLAQVLDHQKPHDRRFVVTEVDVFGQVRDRQDSSSWTGSHGVDPIDRENSSPVVARLYEVPTRTFDFVVLDMPPPGEPGKPNVRNTWKTQQERRLKDPGALCPKNWSKQLRAYVERLPNLLAEDGQAILILPKGVREARRYHQDELLLDDVDEYLAQAGLETLRDLDVNEEHPRFQPFVGSSRPLRRVIIVQRKAV
jgi:hypothetical protein